jgi:hypothetical protein
VVVDNDHPDVLVGAHGVPLAGKKT